MVLCETAGKAVTAGGLGRHTGHHIEQGSEKRATPVSETAAVPQQSQPQIVYVQVSAPTPTTLTPIQQAQLENQGVWRSAGIVCIILLVTFFFAWAIPIVLIAVLIGNGSRISRAQRDMALGVTEYKAPESSPGDNDAPRWVLAAVAGLIGLLATAAGIGSGTATALLIGLAFLAGAAALAPWRSLQRG